MQYALNEAIVKEKITLQEWAEQWRKTFKEGKTGNSSQRGYLLALNNYIFPTLGHMKLPEHILQAAQQLQNIYSISQSKLN